MGYRKKTEDRRTIVINFTVTKAEYATIMEDYDNSACRTRSDFWRRKMLGKKIIIFYRNKSFDEFIKEAIRLRKEMQAIKDRNVLDNPVFLHLLVLHEGIKKVINQIFDLCSQK